MALPTCKTIAPDGLTPHGAFLNGKCITNGGSQAQLRFAFLTYPKMLSWQYTSWQDVEEGETVNLYCPNLSYISTNDVQCQVRNDDGFGWGDVLRFWLPTPTKPKEGAPWLALTLAGEFTDTDYLFTMTTDIPCHLHCLVGSSKPWVSLSTHIIRGVVFHHDPELYFKWFSSVTQDEAGDTTTHTFTLPCPLDNVTYWLVARGTVDGKESPSISPPFSYQRTPVPEMGVLDAYGITTTSAYLPGLLINDQGVPAFVRHRYTKTDVYNQYTPIVGPYHSPKQFDQLIDSLDPDTEYKFASMGSHDYDMERYGWSYPKYFRTLAPTYYLKCHTGEDYVPGWYIWFGYSQAWIFKPTSSYGMTRAVCRLALVRSYPAPAYTIWTFHETNPDHSPKGPALFEFELPPPTEKAPLYNEHVRTFPAIQLIAGKMYAFVWHNADYPSGTGVLCWATSTRTCRLTGCNRFTKVPPSDEWLGYASTRYIYYRTYSLTP